MENALKKNIFAQVDEHIVSLKRDVESAESAKVSAAVAIAKKYKSPDEADVMSFAKAQASQDAYERALAHMSNLYQQLRRIMDI